MQVEPQQLRTFVVSSGLANEKQFDDCLKKAQKNNENVEDILVAEKIVEQADLIRLKAYILGIPFINLEKDKISADLLRIIPEPIARTHNIIAFRKKGKNLEVAMLDPEDLKTIEFIKKKSDLTILPRLTSPQSIKNALSQYQESLQAEFGEIIKQEAVEIKNIQDIGNENEEAELELEKKAQEVPIIKIVDTLLKHAILQGASDIHIEPMENEVLVRYRIDGILHDAMTLPVIAKSGIVARIKVLSNLKLDEHRLPQDGRFKIETNEYKYSVRVSVLPVFNGEKIVMRLLPETTKGLSFEQLGITGSALEKIEIALKKPVGMVLVTGPTGSGKTTTLYSMMEILNKPFVNISTVEDPIEYRMPRVNQTQVNPLIGLTFASGLRSLLRQDPNIIMVGEIRDNETASLAINASLTGHLVLSTLHTNSAAGAIPRLVDMKVEPFLLASTLNVVIAQRLVRRLTEEKEEYYLHDSDLKNLSKYCNLDAINKVLEEEKILKLKQSIKEIPFYKPKPSKEAPDGYKGRVGIYEVLDVDEAIRSLLQKGASADELQNQAVSTGMRLMFADGFTKAARGQTSVEEILRVITE